MTEKKEAAGAILRQSGALGAPLHGGGEAERVGDPSQAAGGWTGEPVSDLI